jgi:xanthine dehydrogenase YagS FAD-binding subunit
MNPFTYSSPTDLPSVLDLLGKQWGRTEILAGGTDLLALLKDDIVAPSQLVNIKKVGELDSLIIDANKGLQAGCLVTLDELAREKRVTQLYPALAMALNDAASPQIRNMATLGGNLCQRPRCWYFRNGYGLLALDANGESLVLKGDNRYHAILGNTGPAYFVSPSTIAPVLVALGANIDIAGPKGSRSISLEEFYRIPLKPGEREHDLAPNEMVIRLKLPPPAMGSSTAYYEVRQKHGFDWPVATATVSFQKKGNDVTGASVVLGHVAPVPWRSKEAEAALIGKVIDDQVATDASNAALQPARNLGQNGYKVQVARVALQRAILEAAGAKIPSIHRRGARS